jgi:ACS family hexuronate transporter-like MFS transporter
MSPATVASDATSKVSRYRWVICALVFFATTVNYIDRQVIGILAPTLQREIGWTEVEYGYIVTALQAAYAIGLLLVGRLLDVLGTRIGYALALAFWSVAAMAHALARTPFGFGAARFALGLGESGNFPAAIKTMAEWFPRRERALATGIFNAGTNVGAVIAPLAVPWIAVTYGWRWAFILTGAIGLLWLLFWLPMYDHPDRHPRVKPAELALIRSEPADPAQRIPWLRLLPHRQTWAFAAGKFMTDPIWWFYLYWIPKFLHDKHGLSLLKLGPPLVAIYLIADIGSIGGGWLSSTMLRRGVSVNRARKLAMLVCAACVTPIVLASGVTSMWVAVALVGLAAAAHQGWSANMFTLASDLFPRSAVASVVGLGGMAGAIGGMLIATATGWVLELTGSYRLLFTVAGSTYLVALLVVHVLAPRLEPAPLADAEGPRRPATGK